MQRLRLLRPACPYGVITQVPHDGRAFKCTLCYDRQKDGLEPACAKACPTNSIMFGEVEELEQMAEERVATHAKGYTNAFVYGTPEVGGTGGIGGNHSKFILMDEPETYNLPKHPYLRRRRSRGASWPVRSRPASSGRSWRWLSGIRRGRMTDVGQETPQQQNGKVETSHHPEADSRRGIRTTTTFPRSSTPTGRGRSPCTSGSGV